MRIDLIRHAQSIANEKEIFSGSAETPLSEEGRRSAEKFAEILRVEQYTKHFSSPLSRALRTAAILFPNAEITADLRLIERNLGQWEGRVKEEVQLEYPHAFLPSGKLHPLFTPPNGEDIPTVAKRLIEFLQTQISNNFCRVAIVTHNGVIRTLRTLIEDLPIEKSFLESEKNLQIRSFNIDATLLDLMRERRLALVKAIQG